MVSAVPAGAITTSLVAAPTLCATTFFPADGILNIGAGVAPLTLTEPAVFHGPCPTLEARDADTVVPIVEHDGDPPPTDDIVNDSSLSQHDTHGNPPQSNWREPFYTSPFPLAYALAATTITSYMLVIMLFITPRSFLDGGIVYLGRRGFTNSAASGVNIGGRPWLQKVAALTVAMSLTVATADTMEAARDQWSWGVSNAKLLSMQVMGSTELKVIRLVSDTFLWLAQAQTLIRLFPRQKERVIIKWAAFALIVLDLVFSAINSFMYSTDGVTSDGNPNDFVHPIPALSYIFQLSLGILYAAWVIYYAIVRRRYAFYHPLMRNISLVAIISIIAILIPIVFFILDISKPDVAGWGDYVRWVGAAAASVVVWEWVERIEALEREDKKDGILGREVFDDDLNFASSRTFKRPKTVSRDASSSNDDVDGHGGETQTTLRRPVITWGAALGGRQRQQQTSPTARGRDHPGPPTATRSAFWPTRPANAVTPISRTDTSSAASTAYTMRRWEPGRTPDIVNQHLAGDLARNDSTPRTHEMSDETISSAAHDHVTSSMNTNATNHIASPTPATGQVADIEAMEAGTAVRPVGAEGQHNNTLETNENRSAGWRSLPFAPTAIFKQNDAPPAEVSRHTVPQQTRAPRPSAAKSRPFIGRWDFAGRLEEFAANQAEKIRERVKPTTDTANLPVMRIPAPPRQGAALQQVLEEEEMQSLNLREQHAGSPSSTVRQQPPGNAQNGSDSSTPLSRGRSGQGATPAARDAPLPPNNPPLWPGVEHRYAHEDDDDDYSDSSSLSDESSVVEEQSGQSRSEGGAGSRSGPSQSPRSRA